GQRHHQRLPLRQVDGRHPSTDVVLVQHPALRFQAADSFTNRHRAHVELTGDGFGHQAVPRAKSAGFDLVANVAVSALLLTLYRLTLDRAQRTDYRPASAAPSALVAATFPRAAAPR